DGDPHAADRPCTRDQHVFAKDGERQRSVDGVAERVEDRGDVLRHARTLMPEIRHRKRDVFRERTGALDAEPDRMSAEVAAPGHAVAAAAADDVPLAADDVAGAEVAYVRPDLDDLADELVADHERDGDRLLRPGVPRVDVEIRAANPGFADPDERVVDP